MRVTLTDDSRLSNSPVEDRLMREVVTYLNQDPRHAVVIHGTYRPVYVLRGASEQLDNFYYGDWPAEDPNDADGGDLTAIQAVKEAIEMANHELTEDER